MMRSALAICLVAALLCGAGARDLLSHSNENSCATYTYSKPKDINQCPCSGPSKDGSKKFTGTFKMKNFWVDDDNQMWCDGEVSGSYGKKPHQSCDKHPMRWPVTVEKCGNKCFNGPGGKCKDWCSAPSGPKNQGSSSLSNLPKVLDCSIDDIIGTKNSKTCGTTCPLVSIFFGDQRGANLNLGDVDITLGQVELIVGGCDHGILDELVCLIGNLLDFGGDRHHMCGMLNSWMGGCRHPDKCNGLGAPGVPIVAITADLELGGLGGIAL